MRYLILIILLTALMFPACKQLLGDEFMKDVNKKGQVYKTSAKLSNIIKSAEFEVSNIMLYTEGEKYTGKVIAALGYVAQQDFIKETDKKFYMVGTANGRVANFIIELDHPLQKQKKIDEDIELVVRGKHIRVFGRFKSIDDYMVEDGTPKKLPVIDAIAIYSATDERFERPLWVSLMY